jgi:hypothetical protein
MRMAEYVSSLNEDRIAYLEGLVRRGKTAAALFTQFSQPEVDACQGCAHRVAARTASLAEKVKSLVSATEQLLDRLEIPRSIADLGISEEEFERAMPSAETGAEPSWGHDERASLSRWANPGTDSQIPANCAGNWCQSRVCDAVPVSVPKMVKHPPETK